MKLYPTNFFTKKSPCPKVTSAALDHQNLNNQMENLNVVNRLAITTTTTTTTLHRSQSVPFLPANSESDSESEMEESLVIGRFRNNTYNTNTTMDTTTDTSRRHFSHNNDDNNNNSDTGMMTIMRRRRGPGAYSSSDSNESDLDFNSNDNININTATNNTTDNSNHDRNNSNHDRNNSNHDRNNSNDSSSSSSIPGKKRSPLLLDRFDSLPWDDSGFSSCCCLSEDCNKDDNISQRCSSHDCSFDGDDTNDHQHRHPHHSSQLLLLSAFSRARSISIDSSTSSSDNSDSYNSSDLGVKLSSLLSSSLPNPTLTTLDYDNDYYDNLESVQSSAGTLAMPSSSASAPRVLRMRTSSSSRSSFRSVKRRKSLASAAAAATHFLNKDDPNNNSYSNNTTSWSTSSSSSSTTTTTKTLHSRLRSAPFQFVDAFRNHGLMAMVACILYTLFLVFLLGAVALFWQIFKPFVCKKDLRELRDDMMESRRRREMTTNAATGFDFDSFDDDR